MKIKVTEKSINEVEKEIKIPCYREDYYSVVKITDARIIRVWDWGEKDFYLQSHDVKDVGQYFTKEWEAATPEKFNKKFKEATTFFNSLVENPVQK